MPTAAATASSPRISGLIPPPSAATGRGGGGACGGGGGTASVTGRTQPVGPCAAAAAAAAPHIAAAGAPPLIAVSTAHGSACGAAAVAEAIAAVELIISEPATNMPMTRFNPCLAMLIPPAQRVRSPAC